MTLTSQVAILAVPSELNAGALHLKILGGAMDGIRHR